LRERRFATSLILAASVAFSFAAVCVIRDPTLAVGARTIFVGDRRHASFHRHKDDGGSPSQLFVPVKKSTGNGERFEKFLMDNFPWDRVEYGGEPEVQKLACEFIWNDARCALIHCYGLRSKGGDLSKFARPHSISDERLTAIEQGEAPPKPFFERFPDGTVVWVEGLYWGLRRAIVKALDTPDKAVAVEAYIKSGSWDRKARRRRS
jgi:hypothetical protein